MMIYRIRSVADRRQLAKTHIYSLRMTISEKPHYAGPKVDPMRLLLEMEAVSHPPCAFLFDVMFLMLSSGLFSLRVMLTLNLKVVDYI